MNTKRLIDKLLDNWFPKTVCFVIAVLLYFFHQASLVDTKTFVLPLQIYESGMVMHVGDAPKSVTVVVRANDNDIKTVSAQDMSASVSLEAITEKGVYKLPVKITLAEQLMKLDPFEVKIKEETVVIHADKKAFKYVPILPTVVGEVAHGYEVQSISMNPSTVEIFGPESLVNATNEIYSTRLNVSNAENNFATEVSYQNHNELITVIDDGPFKATVSLAPKIMEREFTDVPVEIINVIPSLEVETELPGVSLKLSGAMPVLEDYILSKHAVQLNCYEIKEPGTYVLPVRYILPANLQLVEKSDEEFTITVVKETPAPAETEEGEWQ